MEKLSGINCDPSLEKREFLERLLLRGLDEILDVRVGLFREAQKVDLAHDHDELVSKRAFKKGKSLKVKNAEDVWSLCYSIRNNSIIPCDLLKNGKRDKSFLHALQETSARVVSSDTTAISDTSTNLGNSTISPSQLLQTDATYTSQSHHVAPILMMKEINTLKQDVANLHRDLQAQISSNRSCQSVAPTCHLCISFPTSHSSPMSKLDLENTYKCPMLTTCCVKLSPSAVYKIKVVKERAIDVIKTSKGICRVYPWISVHSLVPKNASPTPPYNPSGRSMLASPTNLRTGTWNCHGIKTSIPVYQTPVAKP